jgi:hypothetical protein
MTRNGWGEVGRTLRAVTIALLATGWLLGTPVLAFEAMITGAAFFGEQPTPEEQRTSTYLWLAALACGVLFPLVGMALGAMARSRAVVTGFAVTLLVSFGVVLFAVTSLG